MGADGIYFLGVPFITPNHSHFHTGRNYFYNLMRKYLYYSQNTDEEFYCDGRNVY
jgi:hypothetical protein